MAMGQPQQRERPRPLTSTQLAQLRGVIVDVLASMGLHAPGGRTAVSTVPVKLVADSARAGIMTAAAYHPSLLPPDPADDLAEDAFGALATRDDDEDVEDVELWDVAAIGAVLGHHAGRSVDGKPILLIDSGVRRVKLTQTGGSAGDKTTACSFIYTVKTLNDVELDTELAPEWPSRSENGVRVAATAGLAYRDTDGHWQIAIAFEGSGTGGC